MGQERSSTLLGPTGQPIRIGHRRPLRLSTIERELKTALRMTETPRKVGEGPAGFALAKLPEAQPFRWDSNKFYARLGLEPGCPRVDIVRAFHDSPRETGEQSLYFSTAAKALLKKSVRRLYDSLSLGHYLGDDPALVRAIHADEDDDDRLGVNEPMEWAYYADGSITEDDVKQYDFGPVRTMLVSALAPWAESLDDIPFIGLGLTSGETRWVPVGYLPVLMLGVDVEVTEEYASQIAALLRRSAPM